MANYLLLEMGDAYDQLEQFAVLMTPVVVDQEEVMSVIINTFADHQCDDDCQCASDLFEWLYESTTQFDEKENESDEEKNARCDQFEAVHNSMIGVLCAVQENIIHTDPYTGGDPGWSYIKRRGKHNALLVQNQTSCT